MLNEVGKYERKDCLKELKAIMKYDAGLNRAESEAESASEEKRPDILNKSVSEISKKDVELFYQELSQWPQEIVEKVRGHIEISNWWKGLNSKARSKNRKKYPELFK